jgi:hypothetical protein
MKEAVELASGLMKERMDGFPSQFVKRGESSKETTTLRQDITWLKVIGWAILGIVGGTIALAISLYFPMAENQKNELLKMSATIDVNSEKIRALQMTDVESKSDRNQIHRDHKELLDRMQKYHEAK